MADDAKVEPNFTVAYILNSCWRHGIAVAYRQTRQRLPSQQLLQNVAMTEKSRKELLMSGGRHRARARSTLRWRLKKGDHGWKWSSPGESGTTAEGTVAAVGRSCQVCNCFHSHRTCRPWAPQFLRPPTVIFLEIANLACFLSDMVAGG